MPAAPVCPRRFQVPDRHHRGARDRRGGAGDGSETRPFTTMTATTMTMVGARPAFSLDRVTLWLLLAFVASLQISIAAANVLLAATLVCWAVLLVRDRIRPAAPT